MNPSSAYHANTISSRAPSTTQPTLHGLRCVNHNGTYYSDFHSFCQAFFVPMRIFLQFELKAALEGFGKAEVLRFWFGRRRRRFPLSRHKCRKQTHRKSSPEASLSDEGKERRNRFLSPAAVLKNAGSGSSGHRQFYGTRKYPPAKQDSQGSPPRLLQPGSPREQ